MYSWARDNTSATAWPCFQAKKWLVIAFCLYPLWLLLLDTETLTFFDFFLGTEALLRCRIVVVAKLKNVACPALFNNAGMGASPVVPFGSLIGRQLGVTPGKYLHYKYLSTYVPSLASFFYTYFFYLRTLAFLTTYRFITSIN